MTDIVISCDAFARLASVVAVKDDDIHEIFSTIRFDGGQAIATSRRFMAIENIGGNHPIFHIIADPVLVQQCQIETAFNSQLTITINEILKYAVAKTTLGYVHAANVLHCGDRDVFDRWRQVVLQGKDEPNESNGGMFWDADGIATLAKASPSGRVVFQQGIDTRRPCLIRDVTSYDWLGVFQPYSHDETYSPATLPSWMKP